VKNWVRPTRTALQVLIALIPVVPLLVPALGLSATAGLGASLVTVASLASRVMMIPAVEQVLKTLRLDSKSLTDEQK
jgi:hypothetical protein